MRYRNASFPFLDQANASVWKSGLMGGMPMKQLSTDSDGVLRGDVLEAAIKNDRKKGLVPCYVSKNVSFSSFIFQIHTIIARLSG